MVGWVEQGFCRMYTTVSLRNTQNAILTLMLLVANLANTKWCKKPWKMTETLAHVYSSESTQRELSNEYHHERVKMILVLRTKVTLTLTMLRLLLPQAQGRKDLGKPPKPCRFDIHWIALAEHSQMSTHLPGFQSFVRFLHHFVLARLAISSIRVNIGSVNHAVSWITYINASMLSTEVRPTHLREQEAQFAAGPGRWRHLSPRA